VTAPTGAPAQGSRSVLILNWRDTSHPEGGGSEVYVEHVAAGLASRGDDVVLFCARHVGAPATERRDGFTIIRRGGRFSVYLWAWLLRVFGRLGRPDLVVEVQNGVPFLAAAYSRCPVVVLVHHVHREQWPVVFSRPVARLGWWVESRVAPLVNRGHRYVTVSDATRQELTELGVPRDQISVVHNGTTPPLPGSPLHEPTHSPTIAVVGRLVPHKRVELALDAVAELLPEMPDLHLLVLGHGWWEHRLVEHAHALGLHDHVTFEGFVDEARKHEVLGTSWVLAVPSLKEGWGLVVVEAAAHATPAVAFHGAGGLEESIEDGISGLLVPDERAFVAALRRLLTDPSARDQLGRGARHHAMRYTWEATVEGFSEVVDSVTGPVGRGGRSARAVLDDGTIDGRAARAADAGGDANDSQGGKRGTDHRGDQSPEDAPTHSDSLR